MKKKLLILGILSLLATLGGCNNNSNEEKNKDSEIRKALYEEVAFQQDIAVDGTSGLKTAEEKQAYIKKIEDHLQNDVSQIQARYFEVDRYDSDDFDVYTYDNYFVTNYYKDYSLHINQVRDVTYKTGAVKYTKHSENNSYYTALPEHEMKFGILKYDDPADDIANRYYYADSSYSSMSGMTENEKKEAFYSSVYKEFDPLDFHDSSVSLSNCYIYKIGDTYLFEYTSKKTYDYEAYSTEIIQQYLTYADKEGYVLNATSYYEYNYLYKIDGQYHLDYQYTKDYRRFHYDYSERVNSDKSSIKIAEETFAKGIFEKTLATGSASSLTVQTYPSINSRHPGSAGIGANYYFKGGIDDNSYTLNYTLKVIYTTSLYADGKTFTLHPVFTIDRMNEAAKTYIIALFDGQMTFKYDLTIGDNTYKRMNISMSLKTIFNESGDIEIQSASLGVYWSSYDN